MTGFTRLRGTAWIEQIFVRSSVARRGGPVRRSIASINRHACLKSAYLAAIARGWLVVQIGSDWHFFEASLPIQRVEGISRRGTPLIAL